MTQIFSIELARQLVDSQDQFPVDFELAWQWIGYAKKQNGKDKLTRNFEEGLDYTLLQMRETNQDGTFSHYYEKINLTIDCFKSLGMMARTEQGKEVRKYFLQCEKIAKTELSRLEILELAIASEKEKLAIKAENEANKKLLIDQEKVITKQAVQNLKLEEAKSKIEKEKNLLEEKVEKEAPLVELAKKIQFTEGCVDFNTYAKIIGTGRVRLFKKMREANVVLQNSNMPYQKWISAGYFEASEKIVQGERPDGSCYDHIYPFALVTGKGQIWLHQRLTALDYESSESESEITTDY
jgi:phage antirepressor YoqD-like protein/phage anti-repressor protein